VAVLVMELEHRVLDDEALGQAHELLPVGDAPELAVGDYLEAAVLLQLHHAADCFVLHCAEGVLLELALSVRAERVAQLARAQQAADVVGAKGRAPVCGNRHGDSSLVLYL
jgi:hypothetical protein